MKRRFLVAGVCVIGAFLAVSPWLMPSVPSLSTGVARAGTAADATAKTPGPKLIAIKFHADWCGSCKAMGNVYEELQEKHDQQPVLWLVLDHTRAHHRQQAAFLAQALDLDTVWEEHGGKTGFILLIDPEQQRVLVKLTREHGIKQMGAKLKEALGQVDA